VALGRGTCVSARVFVYININSMKIMLILIMLIRLYIQMYLIIGNASWNTLRISP